MTDWTDITNSQVQPNAPLTSELVTALRDNPTAVAEGSSGAPVVDVSWHRVANHLSTSDTNASIDFGLATDALEGYQAIRLYGGFNTNIAATPGQYANFNIDVYYTTSGWTTLYTQVATTSAFMFWFEIQNLDRSSSLDNTDQRWIKGSYLASNNSNWASISGTATTFIGVKAVAEDITAIRVSPGTYSYEGSTGQATRIALSGYKAKQ